MTTTNTTTPQPLQPLTNRAPLKRGRQPKDHTPGCIERLTVRCFPEERDRVKTNAAAAGCSVSNYIVRRCAYEVTTGSNLQTELGLTRIDVNNLAVLMRSINARLHTRALDLNAATRQTHLSRAIPNTYNTTVQAFVQTLMPYTLLSKTFTHYLYNRNRRGLRILTPDALNPKGRQVRSEGDRRTVTINVKCTPLVKTLMVNNANALGCSLSHLVIHRCAFTPEAPTHLDTFSLTTVIDLLGYLAHFTRILALSESNLAQTAMYPNDYAAWPGTRAHLHDLADSYTGYAKTIATRIGHDLTHDRAWWHLS
ncbi:hypothetical protein H8R18_00695 [Nanchangia anserum]|uniref:Uncharacterized protein n=1 Tax=Nanchangia anserum TaxID=2692125 RepID=A0A8I0G8E4_9ACTO|nr:hypothetical protein [Nanchangia anserum]MBD3689762.1 hypothetical protein [Nanchangia anserum]QOX81933.1 hypothetical protein H8R18_00695 [Nanchangia anserum]